MSDPRATRIRGFQLAADDVRATADFLEHGLGFTLEAVTDAGAHAGRRLRLGGVTLTVVADDAPAAEPPPSDAPAFHHLALVVSDMAAAHRRALASGARAVSRGGPVRLPAASGGVTAWKFRTPGGQALELLEAPTAAWRGRAEETGALSLGVDHTALGCADLVAAMSFYRGLGLRTGPTSHNIGPEQDALDGVDGVDLHIATLFTPRAGPHIELLRYDAPARDDRGTGGDRLALVFDTPNENGRLDGPDGHPLILSAGPRA